MNYHYLPVLIIVHSIMASANDTNFEDEGVQRSQSPPNGGTPNVSGTSVLDSGNVNSSAVSRSSVSDGNAPVSSTPGETTFGPLFDPEGRCYGVVIKGGNIRWGLPMVSEITEVIDEHRLDPCVIPKHFMTEGGRRIFVVSRAVEIMAYLQDRSRLGVSLQCVQLYKRKHSECPHCDHGGTLVIEMFWEDGNTEMREMTYPDLSGMLRCTNGEFVDPNAPQERRFTFPDV